MSDADTTPDAAPDDTPGGPSDVVLELHGLSAGYDGVAVVHEVDLVVRSGEVVALLGANGAGKTTTLSTVSGLLPVLGGSMSVLGATPPTRRRMVVRDVWRRARGGVAHVPEDRGLFADLTVAENLRLGTPRGRAGRAASGEAAAGGAGLDQVMELFPALAAVTDRRAGLLSGGEQQMLALARAVLGRPRLLLVDELSLGLAPIIVSRLLPVLRTIAETTGAGVLVVEQHVPLVLGVADHAYVLDRGRVVLAGTSSEVADRIDEVEAGYLGER